MVRRPGMEHGLKGGISRISRLDGDRVITLIYWLIAGTVFAAINSAEQIVDEYRAR